MVAAEAGVMGNKIPSMKLNICLSLLICGFFYSIPTSLSAQEIPENAFSQGSQWYCNTGYRKQDNQCIKFSIPANAFAQGSQWHCNVGFKKSGSACTEMSEKEKQQQERYISETRRGALETRAETLKMQRNKGTLPLF